MERNLIRKFLVAGIICSLTLVTVSMAISDGDNTDNFADNTESPSFFSVTVTFTKPEKGIYLMNQKILPFFLPLVLAGLVDVECKVEGNLDEVDRVEYYANGNLISNLTEPPFDFASCLGGSPFSRAKLIAVAYLIEGPSISAKIVIWEIF